MRGARRKAVVFSRYQSRASKQVQGLDRLQASVSSPKFSYSGAGKPTKQTFMVDDLNNKNKMQSHGGHTRLWFVTGAQYYVIQHFVFSRLFSAQSHLVACGLLSRPFSQCVFSIHIILFSRTVSSQCTHWLSFVASYARTQKFVAFFFL